MRTQGTRRWRRALLPVAAFAITIGGGSAASAQAHITSPKEFLGHNIGDDYYLPDYDQFMAYWHKIDGESDRMQVVEMGKTSEGRPHLAAIISDPANLKMLQRYKDISMRLAKGEGLTDDQARALAKEGKAVVWIDGGLHATEVLGANQLIETSYQLVSRNDDETKRILRDDIVLLVHANPDGMQLVADWYMKDADTLARGMNIPRLYNKYAGHDNNRDFFMSNLAETKNLNHFMFWDWSPIIAYDHHQTGPEGTVIFSPPFRDPFNYNLDPMIVMGLDLVGAAMHQRFLEENKPGFTMESGSNYSTWWNGGLRTIGYYQGILGLLTEAIGNPTPERIPFVAEMQIPHGDMPAPIAPQVWHFRQSIDYDVTANYAVLDLASRYRETFLYNKYLMAKHAIAKGNRDSWTVSGKDVAAAETVLQAESGQPAGGGRGGRGGRGGGASFDAQVAAYNDVLHAKDRRDPRGYIITADQPDYPTAVKFVNALRHVGVYVDQATAPFTVNGKRYPTGSFVLRTNQAARAQVLDMMEPQDHPNDFAYPGGPPIRPYDNAGWTLAYEMGVKFDRLLDPFDAPTRRLQGTELAKPLAGTVANASGAQGFLLSHDANDAVTVINRVMKAGGDVYWLQSPVQVNGTTWAAGTYYIGGGSASVVQQAARDLGVGFTGTTARPNGSKLSAQRVGLVDHYGGSMPSGWIRLELENFEIPYTVVYPRDIDAGNLKSKYDVLIFPSGETMRPGSAFGGRGGNGDDVPAEFQHMTGQLSLTRSLPAVKQFLADGGKVITMGSSSTLGFELGLPIQNHLLVRTPGKPDRALTGEEFYIPGSVLRVAVDSTQPGAAGFESKLDVFFNNSPVFRLEPDAASKGVKALAWFDTTTPLRSGWAWGQNYLQGGAAAVEADIGKGKLYLFGPEITFRGETHGTFKFLFNGIYAPASAPTVVP
jgi:hypothetical protein